MALGGASTPFGDRENPMEKAQSLLQIKLLPRFPATAPCSHETFSSLRCPLLRGGANAQMARSDTSLTPPSGRGWAEEVPSPQI